jgi:hypothetical protein
LKGVKDAFMFRGMENDSKTPSPLSFTLQEEKTPSDPPTGEEIRPLLSSFTRDGWTFQQLLRVGDLAIFKKTKPSPAGPGEITSFEVVRVKEKRCDPRFGGFSGIRECYPSSERWGSDGWTCLSEERAREKLDELADRH